MENDELVSSSKMTQSLIAYLFIVEIGFTLAYLGSLLSAKNKILEYVE